MDTLTGERDEIKQVYILYQNPEAAFHVNVSALTPADFAEKLATSTERSVQI